VLKQPETLDTELLQEDEAEAKAEAEKTRPGLTMFTDGSRLGNGAAEICGSMAERPILGEHQSPHGLQPGGLR